MGGEDKPDKGHSDAVHNVIGAIVLAMDVGVVVAVLLLDHFQHEAPPAPGHINSSSLVGWVGCMGAVAAFGCYGVLIKTPAVQAARVPPLVFQCYYSAGVAVFSLLIWVCTDADHFRLSYWGLVFAGCWIGSQLTAYNAIVALGYAVGPSIWAGFTIVVSFVWGTTAFGDPVRNTAGAACAILLLVVGICLTASSQSPLPSKLLHRLFNQPEYALLANEPDLPPPPTSPPSTPSFAYGVAMAVVTGLLNGSLMVPLRCFDKGCFGQDPYHGSALASVAFLPSLAIGIAALTPVFFLLYFRGNWPAMHVGVAAVPGFLTGCFWASGNFSAMWATQYLGQTVGFPLTQTCIVINGLWGLLFFHEIRGRPAAVVFCLGVVVIIAGAVLDGRYA